MIRNTKRSFTKKVIIANCIAAWCAIFYSIYMRESQWIAVSAFGLIASIVAYYMEVGHRDLVKLLQSATVPVTNNTEPQEIPDVSDDTSPTQN